MGEFRFTEEQLNYFKLTKVVIDEFPKVLRNTFVKLWNSKHGSVQTWDDSPAVLARLQTLEKPTKTPIPSSPIKEWDCTALLQVTLFSRNFTDPHGTRLRNLVPNLPSGIFHASFSGSSCYEKLALALDQVRLLRNNLVHQCSTTGIDHKSLQHYLQLAKDAFSTLGEGTSVIDAIRKMTEHDFPTDEVRRLEDRLNANESLKNEVDAVKEQVHRVEEEVHTVEEQFHTFGEQIHTVEEQVHTVEEQVQSVKKQCQLFSEDVLQLKETFPAETRKGDGLPSSVLPSTVHHFTGRTTECAQIVHQLKNTANRIVGVVGSPGFGKTSIGKTVAHQISSSNPDTHVYYFCLQGLQSLENLAKKLLTTLNPSVLVSLEKASGDVSAIDQLQDFVRDVHHELFLFLDNVDKFVEAREFIQLVLDLAQNSSHLRILYTSRKPLAFSDICVPSQVVPIKELARNEGADLVETLVPDITRENALKLSKSCGDVPLALQLLCATLQHDHITVEEWLDDGNDVFQLLNTPEIPHDMRFQALFDDAFGRLSESAQRIFQLLAVFRGSFDSAAAGAVLDVQDGIPLKKVLAEIESSSLLEYNGASKRYRLHPLLHSYCRSKVQDKEEIQAAYEAATQRFFKHFLDMFRQLNVRYQSDAWQRVVALFEKEQSNIYETLTQSVRRDGLYDRVNDEVLKTGSEFFLEYVLSNKEYEDLLSICLEEADRRNDKTRRSQILSSKLLIRLLLQDFDGSDPFPVSLEEVAGVTKGKLLCYKGILLTNQNKIEEGIELIHKGIREMDVGGEDPVVKSLSLYFLAYVHQKKENYDQAKQCLKEAENVCLEHRVPKLQIGEVDRFLPEVERLQDAVETSGQAEVDREDASIASVSHPLNVQFCTMLNVIPVVSGDLDGTLRVLNGVLRVRKRKLGEDARTAECYREISRILTLKGDPDKALQMSLEALKIFKALYSSSELSGTFLDTAETYYTIGGIRHEMGDSSGALNAFHRAEQMREDIFLDPLSPGLPHSSNGVHIPVKEMESLVRLQLRRAHDYKRIHQVHSEKGEWSESLKAARKALKFTEMSLGSHEETARSHFDVGKVFQKMGETEKALEEYRTAFEMQEKVTEKMLEAQRKGAAAAAAAAALPDTGRDGDTAAEFYRKIGLASSELKDYRGAHKAFCKSREIYRELGLHEKEAQCCYGLARALYKSENFVESLKALKQCLKMYEELGEREEQVSDCQYWIERAEGQVRDLTEVLIHAMQMREQTSRTRQDTDIHRKDEMAGTSADKESGTGEKTFSSQQRGHFVDKSWYWGPLSRQTSNRFLKNFGVIGDFLVRDSERSRGDYALSVKPPDRIQHCRIEMCRDGGLKLGELSFSCCDHFSFWLRMVESIDMRGSEAPLRLIKPFQYVPQGTKPDGIKGDASPQSEEHIGESFVVKFGRYPQRTGELELARGDVVIVHEEDRTGWWKGALNGNLGWFPSNCVAPLDATASTDSISCSQTHLCPKLRLAEKAWFRGKISRQESESLLMNFGTVGDFIMRESGRVRDPYILSVKEGVCIGHYQIRILKDETISLGGWERYLSWDQLIARLESPHVSGLIFSTPLLRPFHSGPEELRY